MKTEKDKIETVRDMSKLTLLSNRISDVQEENLKKYPFVVFDNIKEVKVDYDLSHEKTEKDKTVAHSSFVRYNLILDESKNTQALQFRFEAIEKWVRKLFWKNVLVEIRFNDKIVFESDKNESKDGRTESK